MMQPLTGTVQDKSKVFVERWSIPPLLWDICARRKEKKDLLLSFFILNSSGFFWSAPWINRIGRAMLYTQKIRFFFFIILLSYFFSLLLSISLNKCLDHLNGSQTLHLRRKWDTVREISDSLLFCFDLHTFGSSSLGGRRWGCKQSSYISTIFFFSVFSCTAIKERKGKSNAGNSCAPV